MRDLRRQPAFLTDRDRFTHAFLEATRLVAHVRDVDAAHRSGDPRELDHFLGRRERAGHVEQPGAQAEGALLHAFPHERAHLLELLSRRRPIDLAHHRATHRSLADEHGEVRRDTHLLHLREKWPQWHRRSAVGTFDERGHALPHVVVGGRHLEDAAPRVRVDVDESRRNDEALHFHDPRRRLSNGRRDANDGVSLDGEVGHIPGAGGAVDDASTAQNQVVGGRLGRSQHRHEQ